MEEKGEEKRENTSLKSSAKESESTKISVLSPEKQSCHFFGGQKEGERNTSNQQV